MVIISLSRAPKLLRIIFHSIITNGKLMGSSSDFGVVSRHVILSTGSKVYGQEENCREIRSS